MNKENYIKDLERIKDIMNRSSRFVSLSGLSGISAGIIAILGALAAYLWVFNQNYQPGYEMSDISSRNLTRLALITATTLILAIGTAIYFTTRETRKKDLKFWDYQTKMLLINLAIPLFTGGFLCLILIIRGYLGFVAPLTLIFYGLALINASKYTINEIRSLGFIEIILGLAGVLFIELGIYFWAIGFGVFHIIYGLWENYRRKS